MKLVPELLGGDGVEIDEYVLLEKGLLAYHGATLKLEISVVDVRGLPESLNNALVRSQRFSLQCHCLCARTVRASFTCPLPRRRRACAAHARSHYVLTLGAPFLSRCLPPHLSPGRPL